MNFQAHPHSNPIAHPRARRLFTFRLLAALFASIPGVAAWNSSFASESNERRLPEDLIRSVTQDVLGAIRLDRSLQRGDLKRLNDLVDQRVMPVVDFARMTSLTVGVHWRRASPEQQAALMAAFRELLLLTYSDTLRFVQDTNIQIRPPRYRPEDLDVTVQTYFLLPGREPIQLDYRLHKTQSGWKVYDFNVLGLWMVDHYRVQFGQVVSTKGIDGLVALLEGRNRSLREAWRARAS